MKRQQRELGRFLRARRAQLKPEDFGLPRGISRRRTPGLRREEVAQISGIGLTWYTWLEQGRDIPASEQTVELLARALRLNPEEHRYLRRLAGLHSTAHHEPHPESDASIQRTLDSLVPNPAYVLSRRFDYVAWNEAYTRIYRDPSDLPAGRRNLMWAMFTDPRMQQLLPDWERRAFVLMAQFRAVAGRHAEDGRFGELVAALECDSPKFRQWWQRYPVMEFKRELHRIQHPVVGVMTLERTQMDLVDVSGLSLVLKTPLTADDRAALERLMATPTDRLAVGGWRQSASGVPRLAPD